MIPEVDFLRAKSFEEALFALSREPRTILAGGTDVFPSLKDGPLTGKILDISGIRELKMISNQKDVWRIGAAVTWQDLIMADLPPAFTALKLAAAEVGSTQIQKRATLVGNLCNASPAADGIPVLLILDAEVELMSRSSTRRIPLSSFILGNRKTAIKEGEMVSAICIPSKSTSGLSSFLKLGARRYLVISIGMIAVLINTNETGMITNIAVAIGACSEIAQRMPAVEKALEGVPLELAPEIISGTHFTNLSPIDDLRSTSVYRRDATLLGLKKLLKSQFLLRSCDDKSRL